MSNIKELLATRVMIAAYLITIYMLLVYTELISGNEPAILPAGPAISAVAIILSIIASVIPTNLRQSFVRQKSLYWAILLAVFILPFVYPLYISGNSLESASFVWLLAGAFALFFGFVWLVYDIYEASPVANDVDQNMFDMILYAFIAIYITYFVHIADANFQANFPELAWFTNEFNAITAVLGDNVFEGLALFAGIWLFTMLAIPIASIVWANSYTKSFFIIAAIANSIYLNNKGVDFGPLGETLNYAAIVVLALHTFLSKIPWNGQGYSNSYDNTSNLHQSDYIEPQSSLFDDAFDRLNEELTSPMYHYLPHNIHHDD